MSLLRGRDPKQDAKLGEGLLVQKDIRSALIHTYSVVHLGDSRLCRQVRVSKCQPQVPNLI